MSLTLLKTGAIAATALMISAGGAFAAPLLHGVIDYDTKVKANHSNGSVTLQWADEGQNVTVLNSFGNWYYVKLPGPDGWVKKSAVDVDYPDYDNQDDGPNVNFCFNGPYGYFCVNH
jgi:hypothetical protein